MFRARVGADVLSLCSVAFNLATVAHLDHIFFFYFLDALYVARTNLASDVLVINIYE